MKKIFTISAMAFSMLIFAQEAGRVGELLKNEANKSEMQTQRQAVGNRSANNSKVLDNSAYRNGNRDRDNKQYKAKTYQWNNNYGNSEVFLRIPERGYFSVEVGDQVMSNASGKFRFFDLAAGNVPISIYEDGYLVYRTKLNVRNNMRMVLDFFSNKGLYLLDSYQVQGKTYGFNEWDDVWNNPYANQNGNWNNGYENNGYYQNVMSSRQFADFFNAMNKSANFDEERTRFISQQMRDANFTSDQIFKMLKEYSFDKNRLQMAKQLYAKCVDRKNFYLVYDAFDFDSAKRDLSNYVART
ncbi:DUF4476 domain-containing protein [uncultured Chryseobacterium sp.]|uniref:DUF4476 domain-containing protein n=1 Tax=uncultured Chryseobacterium sp. TaxID=259322 RepID=UPI0026151A26|nr:DUF4476 domain-containing protein [uncultured Chryseobacterium sp.]